MTTDPLTRTKVFSQEKGLFPYMQIEPDISLVKNSASLDVAGETSAVIQ